MILYAVVCHCVIDYIGDLHSASPTKKYLVHTKGSPTKQNKAWSRVSKTIYNIVLVVTPILMLLYGRSLLLE